MTITGKNGITSTTAKRHSPYRQGFAAGEQPAGGLSQMFHH
jgi:hypothetical protein